MPDYNAYTVGWICAVQTEIVAALGLLDDRHTEPVETPVHDSNSYTLGRIGKHNVVIAALPRGQYGLANAANVGRDMARTFPNVRIGLMVGIGGGVPTKHDIRLGDVVVGCPAHRSGGVVQYDHGTAMQGQNISIKGALNQPPISILTAINTLSAEHELNGHGLEETIQDVLNNKPRLVKRFQRPHPDADRLYKADFIHDSPGMSCATSCGVSNTIRRDARSVDEDNPKIHYGLIASGNLLMKDAIVRDRLSAEEDVLCFEMEAAGLSNQFPCVVIRGICDYSDSHKNDEWQGYAAMVAAAYAKKLLLQVPLNKIEAEERIAKIEGLLADVAVPISETREEVGTLKFRSDREADRRILDWLTQVDYTSQQNGFMQQHQRGTGQWFLQSETFQTWLKARKATLFCPGMPGVGKTTMTAITIDHLRSKFGDDPSTSIAFIYFNFQRRNEQGTEDLLASLLKQLSQGLSCVPDALKSLYAKYEHANDRPSIQEMSQTLQAVVRLFSTTFIIIDALDECKTAGRFEDTFLSEICTLRDQTAANILVTSRPSESLKNELGGCFVQEIYAHNEDVISYIDHRMGEMMVLDESNLDLEGHEKERLKALIRDEVSQAVDGIFLLARFHLDYLKDKTTPNKISTALEKLPRGPQAYDEAYGKTIIRIRNQDEGLRNLARRVLTWLTFAQRRLTTLELRHALAVRTGSSALDKRDIESTNLMTHVCMGLVRTEEGSDTIGLLHYTTMEYLRANPACLVSLDGLTPMNHTTVSNPTENETARRHSQEMITATCATYLLFNAFRSGRSKARKKLDGRLKLNPFYDYSARNWGYHAYEASPGSEEVKKFLNSKAHVFASSQAMMSPAWGEVDDRQMAALHLAAYFGLEKEVVRLLGDGLQPDVKDSHDRTPLSYAAEKGYNGVVEKLLATDGVDPDSTDKSNRGPLSYAAEQGHVSLVRQLLKTGRVDPESKDTDRKPYHSGRTALSYAAERGHEKIVSLLLRTARVNPDSRGSRDYDVARTPLSYAAEAGHIAVVRLLLEAEGVDPGSKDSQGRTPLSYAADAGHSSIVSLLLSTNRARPDTQALSFAVAEGHETIVRSLLSTKRFNPNSRNDSGRTPLSFAAEGGHDAIFQLLLSIKRVKPDSKSQQERRTPLSFAAECGHEAIVRLLLSIEKVDPDSQSLSGRTPLSFAAAGGHEGIVRLLLAIKSVNPDSQNEDGRTPLSYAAQGGYEGIVRLLLAIKSVNPDSHDNDGRTPLFFAVNYERHMVARLLLARDMVNPNIKASRFNESGETPLITAACNQDEAMVELLLARNDVNPNSRDNDGRTSLEYAVCAGDGQTAERLTRMLLAKEGVDPHPKDNLGGTPLLCAAQKGHESVVRILLAQDGVDSASEDIYGHTALFHAVKYGHEEVANLLRGRKKEDLKRGMKMG
ncbi:ankyrin repeat [Fusarium albosuccineum]|uniref:Ankyrin repeat n=1 Tax=Fusarium albosuccineum TaxID=1237068 RepID=A0A8H4LQU0_9HYPO|nr:ankyrin repeat [Fusarium albosuccineum]